MTKKPIRRYTVDGKPMTPDDLRRLRDYLSDIEVVAAAENSIAVKGSTAGEQEIEC